MAQRAGRIKMKSRLRTYWQGWDIWIGNRLPARIVFVVLLRVYADYLHTYGHGHTDRSLERAVNDWGKKAYPDEQPKT